MAAGAAFCIGALMAALVHAHVGPYVLRQVSQAAASAAGQFEVDLWVYSGIAIIAAALFFAGFVLRSEQPLRPRALLTATIVGGVIGLPVFLSRVLAWQEGSLLLPGLLLACMLFAPVFAGLRLATWAPSPKGSAGVMQTYGENHPRGGADAP
jgi:hypothetical protein